MNTTITQVKAVVGDHSVMHTLSLKINNISGSLERIIRTVRHRGFEMVSLNVNVSGDGRTAFVELSVCSARHLSSLTKQLEKLFDVQQISVGCQAFKELNYARTA